MPSRKREEIAIIGGGIIGCATAFYLTTHPDFDPSKHHITIFESNDIACGASGKAGGLLASWAFPSQIGPLSFSLHRELARKYDGEKNWDYRFLNTVSLEADIRNESIASNYNVNNGLSTPPHGHDSLDEGYNLKVPRPKKNNNLNPMFDLESNSEEEDTNEEIDGYETETSSELYNAPSLPSDLSWIKRHLVQNWSSLGGTDSTAQLHPYKFTRFILGEAMKSGAVDLVFAKVTNIKLDEDNSEAKGLTYVPIRKISHINIADNEREITRTDFSHVIMTTGPWISQILPDCPISGLRAHSITIDPEDITKISPYAIFTELRIGNTESFSPEIYPRKDEVYICGEGDTLVDLPDPTEDASIAEDKCDELFCYASKFSSNLSNGRVLKKQACYLPVLNVPTSSGPLIGESNIRKLYIASGHSCWGINNSLITGKLLSEIILQGEAKSADISKLDPKLYFDATIGF